MTQKIDKKLRTLQAMQRRTLVKLCKEFDPPVEYKTSWRGPQIAEAIYKRELYELNKPPEEQQGGDTPEKPDKPEGQRPKSEAFEEAVGGGQGFEPVKETRGGPRPGAGRPLGMTADKAVVKNLPQQPNETIVKTVEMIFSIWAHRVRVPEVAVTGDEARQLALPITQLQEHYWPGGIPEIAWVWIAAATAFYSVVDSRIRIIKAAREKKAENAETGHQNNHRQVGDGQDGQGPQSDS